MAIRYTAMGLDIVRMVDDVPVVVARATSLQYAAIIATDREYMADLEDYEAQLQAAAPRNGEAICYCGHNQTVHNVLGGGVCAAPGCACTRFICIGFAHNNDLIIMGTQCDLSKLN